MPTHLSIDQNEGTNTDVYSFATDLGSAADRVALIVVRCGLASGPVTHNTPTVGGSNATQVGTILDFNASTDNRRLTVWKFLDPPSGSTTIAGGFSTTVSQYSVSVIVAQDADDATLLSELDQQTGTVATQDVTAGDADSLIYATVAHNTFNADPYSPNNVTEIEDSENFSSTNHSFASGHADATGSLQTVGFTADSSADFCISVVEVTPVAASTQSTSLLATGTQTTTDVVDETDATTDLHLSVDDDPASPDDNDWVNNAVDVT